MVPLFRYLPMLSSTTYSDPPASGICLPQVSKYLGTLKLHLNYPEPCILCTICKYALHPDSVTRHVAKHKFPLRDRAAFTSVVRSLHLPDPKSLPTRPDHSLAHPQLTVRHGYSCGLYSSILRGIASRFQHFASRREVAPRKRVAIPIQSQPHACCQVATRRDAILMEMRRDVSWSCDIGIDGLGLQTSNSPA
jgi:hypothetical protein